MQKWKVQMSKLSGNMWKIAHLRNVRGKVSFYIIYWMYHVAAWTIKSSK